MAAAISFGNALGEALISNQAYAALAWLTYGGAALVALVVIRVAGRRTRRA
ncbi:hypothetical protein [Lentzea terrae]|uniref:hypothetical protein n=1 Tax=Lentzea terrae TaxID=2200761 RepID=UPI001300411E|nr:hypothetical protein [Lentzea terrae]